MRVKDILGMLSHFADTRLADCTEAECEALFDGLGVFREEVFSRWHLICHLRRAKKAADDLPL